MRFLGSFLSSLLFAAVICSVGFAQDKDKFKLSALPENATQAETQEWLTAALLQNSAYLAKVNQAVRSLGSRSSDNQSGYIDTKISEVKFQGSVLSYRTNRTVQISSGGVQTSGGGGFPVVPQEDNSRVQLDLKDINPDEISLQGIDGGSKTQYLSLRTYDYKRLIHLKSKDTGEITVSVANLIITENVAEQVQAAFIHLVKLCQEQKP